MARSPDRILRYQQATVSKVCIECGKAFDGPRKLKAICSEECKKARRQRQRPQTFKHCERCGVEFGPVQRLSVRFCSQACKVEAQQTGRKVERVTVTQARSAQSLLAYHVKAGNIIRPASCEECWATGCRIEGAHFNYAEPLRVRWLCRSCHVRWDRAEPKGGTVVVSSGPSRPSPGRGRGKK